MYISNGKTVSLGSYIGDGGEGIIYSVDNSNSATKIFRSRELAYVKRPKVLALCNSFENDSFSLKKDCFAFPQCPVFEDILDIDFFIGFIMNNFCKYPLMFFYSYDIVLDTFKEYDGYRLEEKSAVDFMLNGFELLENLHRSRVVLGDINPSNFLFNFKSNGFIVLDIDSCQFGDFICNAWSEKYLDPYIYDQNTTGQGPYLYNIGSDVFSLSCIFFEFLIGEHPYKVITEPLPCEDEVIFNIKNGISFLKYYYEKISTFSNIRFVDNEMNNKVFSRISYFEKTHPLIYAFFVSVFVLGQRNNILSFLDRSNPLHPAHAFYCPSGFNEIIEAIAAGNDSTKKHIIALKQEGSSFFVPESGFLSVVSRDLKQPSKHMGKAFVKPAFSDPMELINFAKFYNVLISGMKNGG
jgi:serine/threonine protein kinase